MAYKKNPSKLADGTPIHVNLLVNLDMNILIDRVFKITKINCELFKDSVELYSPIFGTIYCNVNFLTKANKEQRMQYYNELSKLNK